MAGTPSANAETVVERPGIYARGAETVDTILKSALTVLIDEGASAFTIRNIAARSGMKVGNVSYHFPRKEMLIQVLLDELLETYDKLLEETVRRPALPADEKLRLIIGLCLRDIRTKRTSHLFTELWALANHNAFVADRVRVFYQKVQDFIGEFVAELNPKLSAEEVGTVALFISASMEGATPFLGYRKPWSHRMEAYTAIATKSLIELAKTITSDEIGELTTEVG